MSGSAPNHMAGLADALASAIGADCVFTDNAALEPHLVEWRKLYRGVADVLVKPRSAADVSKILSIAHERGVAVTPQGGRTGLVGGGVPQGGIILSLERLNRIRSIDPLTGVMIVEAGVTLAAAQQMAEDAGMLFPLSLTSEGSCTIGGNLAANAGGTAVLRYGNARELCLGLEVVLADGAMLDGLTALRKDNSGYDLKQLFIGSEGTLGVITAAVLKLFPQPRAMATAFVGVESPERALSLFEILRGRFGEAMTTFEILPRFGLDLVLRAASGIRDPLGSPAPWYVFAEMSQTLSGEHLREALEEALSEAIETGLAVDATVAASEQQAAMLWRIREELPDAQGIEGASIKHDVSVPLARIADLIGEGVALCKRLMPDVRPCPFGHMGDGNLHFNLTQPAGMDRKAFMDSAPVFNRALHDLVLSMGGSIAAEHGVGLSKRGELARTKQPEALALMRAMKAALDPKGILNPGKVI